MKDNDEMTAERSLELIIRFIEQDRKDATRSVGMALLMWGVLVVVFSAIVCVLWNATGHSAWNLLWLVMPLVGWLCMRMKRHGNIRKPHVRTFVDDVIDYIWVTFACMCGITFVLGWISMDTDYSAQQLPITAVILILMCFATTLTGFVLRSNFLLAMVGTQVIIFSFSLRFAGPDEMIFMGLAALFALVLPGLVIIRENKKHNEDEEITEQGLLKGEME